MTGRVHFAYAQARMQSRYGRMAGHGDWHRLERVSDFGQYLQVAGATGLKPWLRHLGPGSDVHQVELGLRLRYREHVRRVGKWVPGAWQPAVDWCARLEDLEAIGHLLSGGDPPAWMAHDPMYRPVHAATGDNRAVMLADAGIWPPAAANDRAAGTAARWRRHWATLWPDRRDAPALDRLGDVLTAPMPTERTARPLVHCFRGAAQRPPAVFAYLAMVRTELSRLRGALVRRRLLPAG